MRLCGELFICCRTHLIIYIFPPLNQVAFSLVIGKHIREVNRKVLGGMFGLDRCGCKFGSNYSKLNVNVSNSKALKFMRNKDGRRLTVKSTGEVLEKVKSFKYLVSHV